ncbi:hypothetical protein OESDEN_23439, partial [Oesophagostomum dentatum]
MIEDLAKFNAGHRKADAVILRTDNWSSDSGTDDFIDVPSTDSAIEQYLLNDKPEAKSVTNQQCEPSTSEITPAIKDEESKDSQEAKTSTSADVDEEWEPALDDDIQWVDKNGDDSNGVATRTRETESYRDLQ